MVHIQNYELKIRSKCKQIFSTPTASAGLFTPVFILRDQTMWLTLRPDVHHPQTAYDLFFHEINSGIRMRYFNDKGTEVMYP
jgi:hypothetical protein